MAKTKNLGLNLTEDENTSFSDWRRSIDGNGSGENKSNFQKIDDAIGDLQGGGVVIEVYDSTFDEFYSDGGYSELPITEEQANQISNNFHKTILKINGAILYPFSGVTGEVGDMEYTYSNTYVVDEYKIVRIEAYLSSVNMASIRYACNSIYLHYHHDDGPQLSAAVVLDKNTTFNEWVQLVEVYRYLRIWYKFGEPNGDGIDFEPEVLITQITPDNRNGVVGVSVFGLVAAAPFAGGKLRAVGVFLDPNAETVTPFEKEL